MLKANLRSEQTDGLLKGLAVLGLSPNVWTLLSLAPAVGGLVALLQHHLAAALALYVLSGFIDMVDGAVARATSQVTARGAYIDGVVDRYVELLLYLGLLSYIGPGEFLSLPRDAWFMLLVFGALMTSFSRAYADHRGVVKDPGELKRMGGLLERGERLILLYAGMVAGLANTEWLMAAVAVAAVLANATALQRISYALRA
ncbi:MAG: Archaetidylinositol phosphate synthase [Methanosaeta sp. PtaB.Bin018]|jgi:phosphatidylglycerophosphate synthase|nr:CDP-alcohol phosphatidyltransferase family protein [Methanothrix sp.]OPX74629.1 MAG: Archaetidylinositol phosphate synthase [Methanosaeta sp. PtaB.Bin018]OPY46568.1 MAG: Archaetidylinositol phosphate synthase [Methanosaeta sp. PtaU1.Bin016]